MQTEIGQTEEITNKIAHLHLSETDDDNSRSSSPSQEVKLSDITKDLPQFIKQKIILLTQGQQFPCLRQNDESYYYGGILEGMKCGASLQIWPKQGNLLEGTWVNDKLIGCCRMNYGNGDIFEGYFEDGRTNGFGIFRSQKKIVKGIWINNMIQGEGQEIKNDGTKYLGQFVNGRKDGKGILFMKDGCKYEGMFKNNKFSGEGILFWNDGTSYQGQFSRGLINGFGSYVNGNGLQFSGQFMEQKDDKQQSKIQFLQTISFLNQYNQTLIIEKIRIL